MISHLWQQYVNVALLPLANNSVTVRREMSVFNNQTISRIEGASNGMLQRVADCASPPFAFLWPAYVLKRLLMQLRSCHFMAFVAAGKTKEKRFQTEE
jgi:hypothetical protein